MDKTSNLPLTIGFKGSGKVGVQAMPLQEGYLKLGFILDDNDAVKFGTVVSANPSDDSICVKGCPAGNIVKGILVYDDAIAENAPAHSDKALGQLPCSVLYNGFALVDDYAFGGSFTNAIEPTGDAEIGFNESDGQIEFIAKGGSFDTGFVKLEGCKVVQAKAQGGCIIKVDL